MACKTSVRPANTAEPSSHFAPWVSRKLAKERMYKTSGHLPYYAESMFPKMEMDEHCADRE